MRRFDTPLDTQVCRLLGVAASAKRYAVTENDHAAMRIARSLSAAIVTSLAQEGFSGASSILPVA